MTPRLFEGRSTSADEATGDGPAAASVERIDRRAAAESGEAGEVPRPAGCDGPSARAHAGRRDGLVGANDERAFAAPFDSAAEALDEIDDVGPRRQDDEAVVVVRRSGPAPGVGSVASSGTAARHRTICRYALEAGNSVGAAGEGRRHGVEQRTGACRVRREADGRGGN